MLATIAAVTVAVIVILAALWYMRRKMREDFDKPRNTSIAGTPTPPTSRKFLDPDSGSRERLSMTAKVMFGAIGGIILIVGLFAFETIRTGSPAEVMFADQLITGAQVAAGVVVGIVGVNMARRNRSGGTTSSTRPRAATYRPSPSRSTSAAWRPTPRATPLSRVRPDARTRPVPPDEARRRGRDPRRHPPRAGQADQTPDPQHAIAIGENRWITRTAKQTPTQSPDVEADYVYSSPIELSYDKFVGMKESNRRKDIRLTSLESTVAVLEKELEKLERRLKSGQYKRGTAGPPEDRTGQRHYQSGVVGTRRAVESA